MMIVLTMVVNQIIAIWHADAEENDYYYRHATYM